MKFVLCNIDISYALLVGAKIIKYEIELPPARNKIYFNLVDYGYFMIPYILDTIPKSMASNQLQTQFKKNVCNIDINE